MESFMEVGRGPNWGCSAKGREKVQQINAGNCITKIFIFYTLLEILLGRPNERGGDGTDL
jgi:hypothetical protein